MGVSGIEAIAQSLLQGLPAHTPAAVIQHASLPQQRHVGTTLGALAATLVREGMGSPAVIVVGDVMAGVAAAAHPQRQQRHAG
jgi:uroporphyrin-III C-methyltransferase